MWIKLISQTDDAEKRVKLKQMGELFFATTEGIESKVSVV